MKITSAIFQVGGPEDSHPTDASVYLIKSEGEGALVDAGTGRGTARILKNVRETGTQAKEIKYLFLTHCHYDHTGGVNGIRHETGCSVVAHELDAEFLEAGDSEVTAASWYRAFMEPTKVNIKLGNAQTGFKVGSMDISFIHAPGHSPGSSVLTVRSDGMLVLFGQDVHGPLNEVLRSVRADYNKSLEFMLSLDADILCEGHFGVFFGKDQVRKFIESFL